MSTFKDGWIKMRGVTPGHDVPPNTVYGWGCRAIFHPGQECPLDIVWDRLGHLWPGMVHDDDDHPAEYTEFMRHVNLLMPKVQEWARYFTPTSVDYFLDVQPWGLQFNIVLVGSPQASGGYFYFAAAAIPSEATPPEAKEPNSLCQAKLREAQRAKRYQEVRQEMLGWLGQKPAARGQHRQRLLLLQEREGLVKRSMNELLDVEQSVTVGNQTWYVIACHGDAALCERFTSGGRRLFATADRRQQKIIRWHRERMPQFWIPILGGDDVTTDHNSARSTAESTGQAGNHSGQ